LIDTSADASADASFLQQLEHSPATPPAATSTPQGSMQLASQSQFQSNLLEQDADMQKAMGDFNSFEDDSGINQRPCKVCLETKITHSLISTFSIISRYTGITFFPSATSSACIKLKSSFSQWSTQLQARFRFEAW
jgi:hypothetical protein